MNKMLGTAAAIAALSISTAANANVVIDLFTTDQATITDDTLADGGVFNQAGGAGDLTIVGGFRDLGVELKQQDVPGAAGRIGVSGGFLNFSTDSLAAATGLIRWDGSAAATSIGNPTSFPLGLSLDPTSAFQLLTIFSDGGYDFTIQLFTDAANYSSVSLSATATPVTLPDGVASLIPLAAFLDCGGAAVCTGTGVDLASIGAIQAIIDPNGEFTSLDLTLNQITVPVPEPASLALVGLGLVGMGAMRRRRVMK